jgi:TRAP-type uncharacterized transport system fused permease subunit
MEKDASLLLEESELGGRRPKGWARHVLFALAVAWSLFQLWATEVGTLDPIRLRAIHLASPWPWPFWPTQEGGAPGTGFP